PLPMELFQWNYSNGTLSMRRCVYVGVWCVVVASMAGGTLFCPPLSPSKGLSIPWWYLGRGKGEILPQKGNKGGSVVVRGLGEGFLGGWVDRCGGECLHLVPAVIPSFPFHSNPFNHVKAPGHSYLRPDHVGRSVLLESFVSH